jgi:hypothetical protein
MDVPPELICHIATFLSFPSLVAFRLTCSYYYQVLEKLYRQRLRAIPVQIFNYDGPVYLFIGWFPNGSHLQHKQEYMLYGHHVTSTLTLTDQSTSTSSELSTHLLQPELTLYLLQQVEPTLNLMDREEHISLAPNEWIYRLTHTPTHDNPIDPLHSFDPVYWEIGQLDPTSNHLKCCYHRDNAIFQQKQPLRRVYDMHTSIYEYVNCACNDKLRQQYWKNLTEPIDLCHYRSPRRKNDPRKYKKYHNRNKPTPRRYQKF